MCKDRLFDSPYGKWSVEPSMNGQRQTASQHLPTAAPGSNGVPDIRVKPNWAPGRYPVAHIPVDGKCPYQDGISAAFKKNPDFPHR